jgi:hypothetical protein
MHNPRTNEADAIRQNKEKIFAAPAFFPSPLVGEGDEIERSEMEPGEGLRSIDRKRPLTRPRYFVSCAPSPTRGEGKKLVQTG